ncbi:MULTISPECIES: hypothetical protein [unclassified Corallococcus]|uniref:hypothetical protein n=1 Tax=unclassified Corallococcus TaxID=2685029 RepID=UPI001A904E5A|nr:MULTISPECIES: hypothetical protein [unclassified Corallococcus]MBN9687118.1 hypothetical protein [Corallococcus sp. NCSPR001]WAS89054.1 hypothetical protein O0N60_19230 [Corallococcus sp. NCRR]
MAYLTLSGIEVRCSASKGLTQKPTLRGPRVRTFSGWAQSGTRSRDFIWSGGTPPMPMADAQALRRLIDGDGHSWSFEANGDTGLVSSKGLAATVVGTVGVGPGSSTPHFGTGGLVLAAGASVTWATATTGNYVAGAWLKGAFSAGVWQHVVVAPWADRTWLNGEEWLAYGDLEADTLIGLGVGLRAPGAFTISNHPGASGPLDCDDLVLLPYGVPESWVPQWAAAATPFGPLPYHRADGTGIPGPFQVLGQAGDAQAVEYDEGGARVQGQYMDFELWQQPEAA